MKMEQRLITPEDAKEMLSRNGRNRTIRESVVEAYARDMKNGKWQLSPDGISFDAQGNLINGQHRLSAIIKAGVPVCMTVFTDVKDVTVFDMGIQRNVVDWIKLNEKKDYPFINNTTIAAIRCIKWIKSDWTKCTNQEIKDFIEKNKSTLRALHYITSNKKTIVRRGGVIAALFFAMKCGVSDDIISEFVDKLDSGIVNGEDESSVVILRDELINWKTIVLKNRLSQNQIANKQVCFTTQMALRDFIAKTRRVKSYPVAKSAIYSTMYFDSEENN